MAGTNDNLRLELTPSSPFLVFRPLEATMKKILLMTGALLALTAGFASAQGVVNLAWGDCGTFGTSNRSFACNVNTGAGTLVGSFTSFVALDSMNGNEATIEYQTAGATMSPWWQIKTPTDASAACRSTALTSDFNFLSSSNCADFWAGNAAGGVGIIRNLTQVNRARILVVCAVALEIAGPVDPNVETYSFKLNISNTKTVGAGLCAGCADGVQIILNSIKCTQNPGVPPSSAGDQINLGIDKTMETLGTFATSYNAAGVPPGATPTKNTTWGAVKSLYR